MAKAASAATVDPAPKVVMEKAETRTPMVATASAPPGPVAMTAGDGGDARQHDRRRNDRWCRIRGAGTGGAADGGDAAGGGSATSGAAAGGAATGETPAALQLVERPP